MYLLLILMQHVVAGLILTTVFQVAHEMPNLSHPVADAGKIDNVWLAHQLETTANFAPKSRLLNWYVGGLNFQVEHHLFSGICHVHYPKIAGIVEFTANEFGLKYHNYPTFYAALREHVSFLKRLGGG
jgi:linoleoyl-CoA desaturase